MSKTLEITLSTAQQVIPINDSSMTFEAQITVTSKTQEPFSALIIDAESLNKLGDKHQADFQHAENGIISATIRNDQNKKDIWYILLKAAKENKVTVQINVVPISETYKALEQKDMTTEKSGRRVNWTIIALIGLGIVMLGIFLFNKFFRNTSTAITTSAVDTQILPAMDTTLPETDDLLARIDSLPDL